MAEGLKLDQKHGKGRVRVSRVWRRIAGAGGGDVIVEWNVSVSLYSNCHPAYTAGDNSAIVATDTMKNTVYAKAKECSEVVSMESFAVLLARHFSAFYPEVTAATVNIVEKPWERVVVDGQPHSHGVCLNNPLLLIFGSAMVSKLPRFKLGSEKHMTEVTVSKFGALSITSGVLGLALLKTTKSGFEGFVRDRYTLLPETRERMVATEVTASWRFPFEHVSDIPAKPFCFTERYEGVKKVLVDTFFGPPDVGVYSPSVQNTLFLMAKAVLNRFLDIASIELRMPNLHFLPVNLSSKENPDMVKFAGDVYMPTDEPHGTIEATLSRTMSKM
ncbi:Uricase [Cocos nucifera]|uniref:Uricase n=1 Tax=Cocos nucifera TaxID=13894 RepID=A0A8K0MVM8_COCNU|nr:Uricase [Cocos nucifera]